MISLFNKKKHRGSVKVVSFLVSGRGSNFVAVAKKIADGTIPARFGILLSDKPDAGALDKAKEFSLHAVAVPPREFSSRQAHEMEMIRLLEEAGTDLVVTAGYMRLLGKHFVSHFSNRIINIHPSLLPAFPGIDAQKQAWDYGVKVAGCTTHFIDEGTDTGPIILQRSLSVTENMTERDLRSAILREEHKALPEAVRLFCEDRLYIHNRKVTIK